MIYKESTEYGSIGFTKKTIGKVVLQCIDEAPMKMVISNKKGKTAGFPHVMGGNDVLDNIGIEIEWSRMSLIRVRRRFFWYVKKVRWNRHVISYRFGANAFWWNVAVNSGALRRRR